MQKDTFRAFFAIDLSRGAKKTIALWIRALRAKGRLKEWQIKWVRPENLHLTLCFLGSITNEQYLDIDKKVREAISGLPQFSFKLTGLKLFPAVSKPRVLTLALEPLAAVKEAARIIGREVATFGVRLEKRAFKPHVTLGFISGLGDDETLRKITPLKCGVLKVTTIKLFKSDAHPGGSVYTPIAIYKLNLG